MRDGRALPRRIRSVFSSSAAVPAQPGPKFVVFHTLLPHDPYIFGARGQPVTFPGRTDEASATRPGRAYYLRQLEYIEPVLLGASTRSSPARRPRR